MFQCIRSARGKAALAILSLAAVVAPFSTDSALAQSLAQCPPPASSAPTCTVASGSQLDGIEVELNGVDDTNDDVGGNAGGYNIDNAANISTSNSGAAEQSAAILLRGQGGDGDSETSDDGTDGGDGGTLSVRNNGNLTLRGFAPTGAALTPKALGSRTGASAVIAVIGTGGRGGDAKPTTVGGGDGGDGGSGADISKGLSLGIENNGTITVGRSLTGGGAGIFGASFGGDGGDQDDAGTGDQDGGNGGASREVAIDNNASVSANGGPSVSFVHGISAQAIGGDGGTDNGDGGTGATISINNVGSVTVGATVDGDFSGGLRAISGISRGGTGTDSRDGGDNGGEGANAGLVSVFSSGPLSAALSGDPTTSVNGNNVVPLSGGIVGVSVGGDGARSADDIFGSAERGGNGGDAGRITLSQYNAAISASGTGVVGIGAFSAGGTGGKGVQDFNGGDGGTGGSIEIDTANGAVITTTGEDGHGIVATSKGGDGGFEDPPSGLIDFSEESAGTGGNAGEVVVKTGVSQSAHGSITTSGNRAVGIQAQSIGGLGAGTGDATVLFNFGTSDAAPGGNGGAVTVDTGANIATGGESGYGILAQSIGGGGGSAGTTGGVIAIAGNGAAAAPGGTVTVTQSGNVTTQGTGATGIRAQSIGGGGGAASEDVDVATVGGQSGTGNDANTATVNFRGARLSTSGDYAYGVQVQSIGAGGGDGGSAFAVNAVPVIPLVAVGGDGGASGNGGPATAVIGRDDGASRTAIATAGENAIGAHVQSVGGGGGSGGDVRAANLFLSTSSFAIAGGAAAGGNGGTSTLNLAFADVTTEGGHAIGALSQSTGGGGGTGGSATSFSVGLAFSSAVAVGSNGGAAGAGAPATVTLNNSTITTGDPSFADVTNAHGAVANSVGGGGGVGGSSQTRAIALDFPGGEELSLPTIEAGIAVGGAGSSGGNASEARVDLSGSRITTQGDGSFGIVSQSIGGGGGLGGSATTAGSMRAVPTAEPSFSLQLNVAVGRNGGSGGSGNVARSTIDGTSSVRTEGDFSNGVLIQSIGGGGGDGGFGSAEKYSPETVETLKGLKNFFAAGEAKFQVPSAIRATVGVGGTGGAGGTAGEALFNLDQGAAITTLGTGAHGVVLQSIGGGGGTSQGVSVGLGIGAITKSPAANRFLPTKATVKVGRNGPNGGNGGTISSAAIDGDITTYGSGADGVLVQSIGGGGGLGGSVGGNEADESGIVKEINETVEDLKRLTDVTFGVGGAGGAGGSGGEIASTFDGSENSDGLRFAGSIETFGDHARGALVQSIGGGGGSGGAADVETSLSVVRAFVAIGGSGGNGGNGNRVDADLAGGTVATHGFGSHGIVLQSVGGGGGAGGDGSRSACSPINIGGGFVPKVFADVDGDEVTDEEAEPEKRCLEVVPDAGPSDSSEGVGGSVGSGNQVRTFSATGAPQSITITTAGDYANGFVAQSIGGGGGFFTAGNSITDAQITGGLSEQDREDAGFYDRHHFVGLGGFVPSGSFETAIDGGTVDINSLFAIATSGDGAAGVVGQSIGGGGGLFGGDGVSGLSIGAENGANGDGGTVTATVRADSRITTSGEGAHGVVVHSIGAGGGLAAGSLAEDAIEAGKLIEVKLGGIGFVDGSGGAVTATIDGVFQQGFAKISTTGAHARGVIAQSIGGGGGVSAGITSDTSPVVPVPLTVGGQSQGNANTVEVNFLGQISTTGVGADALVAQSIGHGGGVADLASGSNPNGIDMLVGGQNSTSGNASFVDVNLNDSSGSNSIVTSGDFAYGILAQSIGGGGGSALDATENVTGSLQVGGIVNAAGLSSGGSTNQFCKNAQGAASACAVRVADFLGTLKTEGDDAHGIVAQSIGGGGGVGRVFGDLQAQVPVDIAVGGSPNTPNGSNSGDVLVKFGATTFQTSGDRSYGIVAQSIGGGGGIASAGNHSGINSVKIGSTTTGLAEAGNTEVNLTSGTLKTSGFAAHGIIAQSIGGGGGIAGETSFGRLSLDVFGSSFAPGGDVGVGNAGAVKVTATGSIQVTGDVSFGIIAQSLGGGGGLGGDRGGAFAGSTSSSGSGNLPGPITITQSQGSTISAPGNDSVGIFAQSQGNGQMPITLTLDGTVIGGNDNNQLQGTAVMLSGGSPSNSLTVGATGSLSAASGTAVRFFQLGGNEMLTITNSGTIDGDALAFTREGFTIGTLPTTGGAATAAAASLMPSFAPSAPIQIENLPGGTITGSRFTADMVNAGTFQMQGLNEGGETRVDGNFEQREGGVTVADMDFATGETDILSIGGDARIEGEFRVRPRSVVKDAELAVIAVDGDIFGDFSLVTPSVFGFENRIENGQVFIAVREADFTQGQFGLDDGQRAVAEYLGAVFREGDAAFAGVLGEAGSFASDDPGSFRNVLTGLTPGATIASGASNYVQSDRWLGSAFGCGDAPANAEGACLKFNLSGGTSNQDSHDGAIGYDSTVFATSAGLSAPLGDGFTAGAMFGYERVDIDGDNGFGAAEGDSFVANAHISKRIGNLEFGFGIAGSVGSFATDRTVVLGERTAQAQGDHTAYSVAARARAAYDIPMGSVTVTPTLDVDLVHSATEAFRETGAGELDLAVGKGSETGLRIKPSITVVSPIDLGQSAAATVFASAGVSFSTEDEFRTSARFADAPVTAGAFTSAVPIGRVQGRLSLGAKISASDDLDINLRYDGSYGSRELGHTGSLSVTWRF